MTDYADLPLHAPCAKPQVYYAVSRSGITIAYVLHGNGHARRLPRSQAQRMVRKGLATETAQPVLRGGGN